MRQPLLPSVLLAAIVALAGELVAFVGVVMLAPPPAPVVVGVVMLPPPRVVALEAALVLATCCRGHRTASERIRWMLVLA